MKVEMETLNWDGYLGWGICDFMCDMRAKEGNIASNRLQMGIGKGGVGREGEFIQAKDP